MRWLAKRRSSPLAASPSCSSMPRTTVRDTARSWRRCRTRSRCLRAHRHASLQNRRGARSCAIRERPDLARHRRDFQLAEPAPQPHRQTDLRRAHGQRAWFQARRPSRALRDARQARVGRSSSCVARGRISPRLPRCKRRFWAGPRRSSDRAGASCMRSAAFLSRRPKRSSPSRPNSVPAPFDAPVDTWLGTGAGVGRTGAGAEAGSAFRLLPHVHGTDGYFVVSFRKG